MKIIKFGDKISEPIAVALGFFDCIHIGHRKIIKDVKVFSKKNKTKSCIFTFKNNPYSELYNNKKLIYSYESRLKILKGLNIDYVISADFDEKFRNIDKDLFLETLFINDIRMLACGKDYRFGYKGAGTVNELGSCCAEKDIVFNITDDVKLFKNKVSSTAVRECLSSGHIGSANRLLGAPYRLYGLKRKDSHSLNFTAEISPEYIKLPDGIYKVYFWLNSVKITAAAELINNETFISVNLSPGNLKLDDLNIDTLFFSDRLN